jgi:hypothetical protein
MTTQTETTATLSASVITACAIARGESTAQTDPAPVSIRGACVERSMRGKVQEEWYRMVLRDGEWTYVSADRLSTTARHSAVSGDVYQGELVAQHERGAQIDAMWLVAGQADEEWVELQIRVGASTITATLPDGSTVAVPNPRRR